MRDPGNEVDVLGADQFIASGGGKMRDPGNKVANAWVFIAQLVRHCSDAEAMGSKPVEPPPFVFGWVKFAILR